MQKNLEAPKSQIGQPFKTAIKIKRKSRQGSPLKSNSQETKRQNQYLQQFSSILKVKGKQATLQQTIIPQTLIDKLNHKQQAFILQQNILNYNSQLSQILQQKAYTMTVKSIRNQWRPRLSSKSPHRPSKLTINQKPERFSKSEGRSHRLQPMKHSSPNFKLRVRDLKVRKAVIYERRRYYEELKEGVIEFGRKLAEHGKKTQEKRSILSSNFTIKMQSINKTEDKSSLQRIQ